VSLLAAPLVTLRRVRGADRSAWRAPEVLPQQSSKLARMNAPSRAMRGRRMRFHIPHRASCKLFFAAQPSKWALSAPTPTVCLTLELLDLAELQIDLGGTAEDRYRDLEARAAVVDLLDGTVERRERTVRHAHLLADLERDRGLGPLDAFLHLLHDAHRLGLGD